MSVICSPRNSVLLVTSPTALSMRSGACDGPVSTEVDNDLQVVGVAPVHQLPRLLPDEAHHCCVVCILHHVICAELQSTAAVAHQSCWRSSPRRCRASKVAASPDPRLLAFLPLSNIKCPSCADVVLFHSAKTVRLTGLGGLLSGLYPMSSRAGEAAAEHGAAVMTYFNLRKLRKLARTSL